MVFLLVDLALAGKTGLVIGKGPEVKLRVRQLLSNGAKVSVLSDRSSIGLIAKSAKNLEIRKENLTSWKSVLKTVRPFLVVVSTENPERDRAISDYARSLCNLIYVVDRPQLNDINMTGVARIGNVKIAVSTGGLSPAMAGLLRRKIQSIIDREDVLQVRLQGQMRSAIKSSIKDPQQRKKLVYELIKDQRIRLLLKSNRFEAARLRALGLIVAKSKGA